MFEINSMYLEKKEINYYDIMTPYFFNKIVVYLKKRLKTTVFR